MKNLDVFYKENDKKSIYYNISKEIMENMYRSINKPLLNESTTQDNLYTTGTNYSVNGEYDILSMQLSKRTFDMIASKFLVGVQPINGPVGVYYALRYIADQTYNGVSGNELGYNEIDSTYSGSYETSASERLGSDSTHGLGIGTGNSMKEISVSIEKDRVETKVRKLRARFSEEIAQDIFSMLNVNLRDSLIDGLAKEVAAEIDYEIISTMESKATTGSLDFSTIAGDNKSDKYNSFLPYVISKCNTIGVNTNHGVGNFIIASPNISTVLESSTSFSVAIANENEHDNIYYAGTVNGKSLYRNIFWTDDKFLIGYKGRSELDAGIFYMPYLQTFLSNTGQDSFQPSLGIMSRYAIGDNIFGTSNYYQLVTVSNYS